jgi:hypothetical protein
MEPLSTMAVGTAIPAPVTPAGSFGMEQLFSIGSIYGIVN